MLNEQKIRQALDNRLSGLTASQVRRDRIRAAVNQERREATPVRSKKLILVIALIAAMLTSAIAVAETLNLFDFFGKEDARFAALAPYATLEITEDMLIEHPHLGDVEVKIDSAYFDGLSLSMAYRISNASCVAAYTPTEEEIARMQPTEADNSLDEEFSALMEGVSLDDLDVSMYYSASDASQPMSGAGAATDEQKQAAAAAVIPWVQNHPDYEVFVGYNNAITSGTPYGYKEYSIYAGDHTYTDDGMDIEPESAWQEYEGNALCEMMNFRVPLDEVLRNRDSLTVTKKIYQQEEIIWFDGKDCWISRDRQEIGTITATIQKAKDAVKTFSGTGSINGVECTFTAEVSPLAAVLTLETVLPIEEAFPINAPEGTDRFDQWREMALANQQGREYRPQTGMQYIDETHASVTFEGTGELPENLTAYAYSMWESADWPELSALEGIALTEVK